MRCLPNFQAKTSISIPSHLILQTSSVQASITTASGTAILAFVVDSVNQQIDLYVDAIPILSASVDITFNAAVISGVFPNEQIVVSAVTNYTSQSASSMFPGRVHSSATDYSPSTASNTVATSIPTSSWSLVNTSLSDTFGVDIAIGENATYHLAALIPEEHMNLIVTVSIPSGLSFVSTSIVSVGSSIATSSQIIEHDQSGLSVSFFFGATVNAPDNTVNAGDYITFLVCFQDLLL